MSYSFHQRGRSRTLNEKFREDASSKTNEHDYDKGRRRAQSTNLPPSGPRLGMQSSDIGRSTGIWLCVELGDMSRLRSGLSSGEYDPNAQSATLGRKGAMHIAAQHGNVEAMRLLLRFGANPCLLDSSERSPLHLAAKYGEISALEFLISLVEVNVNSKDACSQTALMHAVIGGNPECVQRIIDEPDIDLNVLATGGAHFGQTALQIAKEVKDESVEGESDSDTGRTRRDIVLEILTKSCGARRRRLSRKGIELIRNINMDDDHCTERSSESRSRRK